MSKKGFMGNKTPRVSVLFMGNKTPRGTWNSESHVFFFYNVWTGLLHEPLPLGAHVIILLVDVPPLQTKKGAKQMKGLWGEKTG